MRVPIAMLIAVGLCALAAPVGTADGGYVAGDGGGTPQEVGVFDYSPDGVLIIGTPGDGYDVTYDPAGGPLVKVLNVPTGGDHLVTVFEYWHVVGPTIYDWHQQLMIWCPVDGWIASPTGDGLGFDATVNATPVPSAVVAGSDTVDIYWEQGLDACTQIALNTVVHVPDAMTGQQFAIFQWPTIPEPGTAVLLGLGLGGVLLRRLARPAGHRGTR